MQVQACSGVAVLAITALGPIDKYPRTHISIGEMDSFVYDGQAMRSMLSGFILIHENPSITSGHHLRRDEWGQVLHVFG